MSSMAGNYGFLNVDVKDLVREYDKKPGETGGSDSGSGSPSGRKDDAPPPSRAEEIVSHEIGDESREREIRNAERAAHEDEAKRMKALADLNAGRERELKPEREKIAPTEFQSAISAAVRESLVLDNVQRLVALNNQVNMRRGVGRDPGNRALKKSFANGQKSTVKVQTQLLRCVAQEIGPLSSRTNQDDLMFGFLYWYFGRPAGVEFSSDEQEEKINEIVERLGANASPVRMAQAGANTTEAMLDKLDIMNQRMDGVANLLQLLNKDSLGIRTQTGKIYLGLCYAILNMVMLVPPVGPGQHAEDIDILGGGASWSLQAGIDEAYGYVQDTNGREIYKAKHGIRASTYRPPVPVQQAPYDPPRGMYDPVDDVEPDEDGQDDDYEDIPEGFDPLEDDFDDMGIGNDFNPAYMSDPDYDDGIEEGTPEYLQKMRQEAILKERAMNMEGAKEWNDDDED